MWWWLVIDYPRRVLTNVEAKHKNLEKRLWGNLYIDYVLP
jgi:hypothetical protein